MTMGRGGARRVLWACLGAGVTAALAACGGSPGTAAPASPAGASPAGATAAPGSGAGGAPALSEGSVMLTHLFPIGAYVQAPANFEMWKHRGVNTMVVVPDGNSEKAWNKAAIRDGLYEIRAPAGNQASDVRDGNLLAWALPDEPDDVTTQIPYAKIQQTYRAWKRIDPRVPVYINFNGQFNQHDVKTDASGRSWYGQYVKGANWITSDLYPVNNGQGNDLGVIGQEVTQLRQLAGGRPVFVFIESGAYAVGNPVITPAQFRGEVWEAIIHGARGIFYFPVQVTPHFKYDVTPPAVAAEMTRQDATITKLAGVLQGTINPPPLGATAPSPLQVAWRSSAGHSYFFVLNLSPRAADHQVITLRGIGSASSAAVYGENRTVPVSGGTITDSFGPYAIHIYQVP